MKILNRIEIKETPENAEIFHLIIQRGLLQEKALGLLEEVQIIRAEADVMIKKVWKKLRSMGYDCGATESTIWRYNDDALLQGILVLEEIEEPKTFASLKKMMGL